MSLRILVIGGCHVNGFPLGPEHGFARILDRHLSRDGARVECSTHGLMRFRDLDKLRTAIDESTPHLLVLQMGNFEAAASMRKRKDSRGSVSETSDTLKPDDVSASYVYSPRRVVKSFARLAVHLALGRGSFDAPTLSGQADMFFSAVADARVPITVVLTPFPSMDPVIRRQRRRLGRIVERSVARHPFAVVDAFDVVGSRHVFLPDGHHLNSVGHDRIAEAITRAVAAPIEDLVRDECRAAPAVGTR